MKALRVHVNGKLLCTAGVGEDGVVSAIVNWNGAPDLPPEFEFHLSVGGIDGARDEFLEWPTTSIGLGDEISIRIVEVNHPDLPETRRTREEVAKGFPCREVEEDDH